MAIKWAGAGWRTHLDGGMPITERAYIDFRQKVYPPMAGHDMTFALHTSGDNKAGSHYLSGGNAYYLLDMPSKFVMSIELRPNFAYDVGAGQFLCGWYVDANSFWIFAYNATVDKFELAWYDGTTERVLHSRQFDDGGSFEDINQWLRFDIIFDSTTGDTTGSKLYYNRNLEDSSWSGNIDGKTNTFPLFEIRSINDNEGDYKINFLRLFSDVTTNDVANDHKAVETEEIYWPLNGYEAGQTRCNVTRLVKNYYLSQNLGGANTCDIELYSTLGEFADEQYSAFAPADESFNGKSTQRYLQYKTPVMLESWYANSFEPLFVGRVNDDYYTRNSPVGGLSMVSITAEDAVSDLGTKVIEAAATYEDYDICDTASEATSLLHTIVRLATRKSITNYLANSSFENATIGNSWTENGGVLSRVADPLWDSNCGQLANATGSEKMVRQYVTFKGTKKLNVGETYTFSIYLKSAGAVSDHIWLAEYDDGGSNGTSNGAYSRAGGDGWKRFEVSRTVLDSDSDRLVVRIDVNNGDTLKFDTATLAQADTPYDWFVLNNNDGIAGTASADDADSATYETIGFDADDAAITHPWAIVLEGDTVWEYIKELAIASIARYYGVDSSGTFIFKPTIDEPADPSSLITLTSAGALTSQLQLQQANKIIIHGITIVKDAASKLVWSAQATRLFGDDAQLVIILANGDTWPDLTLYGPLWAQYDNTLALGSLTPGGLRGPGDNPMRK